MITAVNHAATVVDTFMLRQLLAGENASGNYKMNKLNKMADSHIQGQKFGSSYSFIAQVAHTPYPLNML